MNDTDINEPKKLNTVVRLRGDTRELLEVVKDNSGWTYTEALHRALTDFAKRKRLDSRRRRVPA